MMLILVQVFAGHCRSIIVLKIEMCPSFLKISNFALTKYNMVSSS
jgi:hypothetical protein